MTHRQAYLVVLIVLFSHMSQAEVILREQFTYYVIEPANIQQIKQQLREKSPISKDNQLFHGGTQWQLRPMFALQIKSNLCHVVKVSVSLEGIYTLPKLDAHPSIPKDTQLRFEQYYSALLEHEVGHQQLWLEAGEKIENMLNNLTGHFQCAPLKTTATERVKKIVTTYQILNQEYDQQTGHGRTQGAYIADN
ncbi:DUF922 domain-containing protein [Aliiglaciecola sp. LCG003]|uniref:DUF922 domain-containing protein n=1 Tax=Aliiglaciecola sp. LCG003 TaxID=3053655 RepID=UPI0025729A81|nr:DUF922 domain-containing protein [Aliiglaciecola sp. LCG003]WJG07913.1 DUF922 domain-containing protein [Aliiglaciecola sp. LCG003]